MKQIEVQIMQQSYLLGCPPGREARLLEAVERVDTAMTRIRDEGRVRSRERIAVLTALNIAVELADRETDDFNTKAERTQQELQAAQASAQQQMQAATDQAHLQAILQRLDTALGESDQTAS